MDGYFIILIYSYFVYRKEAKLVVLAFKPETPSYIYQHENMKSLLKHIVFAGVKKCDWLELKRMNIRVALSTSTEYFGF